MMFTAVVVFAAMSASLVLGTITVAVWSRLRFARSAESFVCEVRRPRESTASRRARWPRGRAHAMWVHDVLLVHRGLLFPRTAALPVRIPEGVIRDSELDRVTGLGPCPPMISLRLDDGPLVDVAVAHADRTRLVGPFFAAAIPGLPRGLHERPNKPQT